MKKHIFYIIMLLSIIVIPIKVFSALLGDVNGVNVVGVSDYILIRKHLLDISLLKGDSLKRADVNGDGKIGTLDYIAIRKYVLYGSVEEKTNPKVHFISLPEGDAILLESNNKYALIDTGCATSNLNSYLDSLKINKLEFVLITHNHADHIRGLISQLLPDNSIKKRNIGSLYLKEPIMGDDDSLTRYNNVLETANRKKNKGFINNIIVVNKELNDGNTLSLGDIKIVLYNTKVCLDNDCFSCGTNNECVHTDNTNSIVELLKIKVENKEYKVLLTGDLHDDNHSMKLVSELSNKIKKIDVLKLPHHGFATCAFRYKTRTGEINNDGVKAVNNFNPKFLIVTNKKEIIDKNNDYCGKISNTESIFGSKPLYYVHDTNNALILEFNNSGIKIHKQ